MFNGLIEDPLMLRGGQFFRPLVTGTLVLNLDALLRARVLSVPEVAEGRVVLSREYEHRASAARLIAFALFVEIVALLVLAFAAGGAFPAATAIGWYRRARQASTTNEG